MSSFRLRLRASRAVLITVFAAVALASSAAPAAPDPIAATEGAPFSGLLATATATCANPSQLNATIDWGDGTTSAGTITSSGSQLSVSGSHTYAEEGDFSGAVSGSYFCDAGGTHSFSATFAVAAADAPVAIGAGPTLPATIKTGQSFTTTIATFTDADPGGTPSDYTATINWGDGTTSTGTIGALATHPGFSVTAAHAYTTVGLHPVQLRLADHGPTVVANGVAHVVAAYVIRPTEGARFAGRIAPTSCSPSTATVSWGDGKTSTGKAIRGGVGGSHTYAEEGDHQGTITYSCSPSGPTTTIAFTARVGDAKLPAQAVTQPRATAGQHFKTIVADFTDLDPGGVHSDYSSLINWGDGHVSMGTITGPRDALRLHGNHTYARSGRYRFKVLIFDHGGAKTVVSKSLQVAPGPVRVDGRIEPHVGNGTSVISLRLNHRGEVFIPAVHRNHKLLLDARAIRVPRAGPVVVILRPTKAATALLLSKHTLHLRVHLKFKPIVGPSVFHWYPIVFNINYCSGSQTFTYTGSEQSCVVPSGVGAVKVIAVGARGGNVSEPCPSGLGCPYGNFGGSGGPGAYVDSGPIAVQAGQPLYIEVGGNGGDTSSDPQICCGTSHAGAGGWNGGGAGAMPGSAEGSGGGGGASDVQTVSCAQVCDQALGFGTFIALASRVVIAGGGGGGGSGGNAGDGGGATQGGSGGFAGWQGQGGGQATISGNSGISGLGGGGGFYNNGGAGGSDDQGNGCYQGSGGKLAIGGAGGDDPEAYYVDGGFVSGYAGGGGGGGWGGGGGGDAGCVSLNATVGGGGGGGGGSSNGPPGTNVFVNTSGAQPYVQVIPLG